MFELKMVQGVFFFFLYSVKSGSQENYSDKQNKRLGLIGLLWSDAWLCVFVFLLWYQSVIIVVVRVLEVFLMVSEFAY